MKIADAAKLMNVSLDMVRKASVIQQHHPELCPDIEAGRLTINQAYRLAKGKRPPDRVERAARLWRNMTEDERGAFLALISTPAEGTF